MSAALFRMEAGAGGGQGMGSEAHTEGYTLQLTTIHDTPTMYTYVYVPWASIHVSYLLSP